MWEKSDILEFGIVAELLSIIVVAFRILLLLSTSSFLSATKKPTSLSSNSALPTSGCFLYFLVFINSCSWGHHLDSALSRGRGRYFHCAKSLGQKDSLAVLRGSRAHPNSPSAWLPHRGLSVISSVASCALHLNSWFTHTNSFSHTFVITGT